MRNLIKLIVMCIVATCSLNTASEIINDMVIEVNKREKTIADALIAQQVKEMFKEAEKEIAKAQEEAQVEIKVEEVKIKPPLPPKEEKPKKKEPVKEVVQEEVKAETEEPIVAEEEVEDAATNSQVDMATLATLTVEDMNIIGEYLVEHYFLFGYEYYQNETDPTRYERKKLASDMEDQIIASIQDGFGLLKDLKSLNRQTFVTMREKATELAKNFSENFKNVGEKGEEFTAIYESGNAFFTTYIDTLQKGQDTYAMVEETTNKALILPILLKQMNESLLPGFKEVLNQGFTLKEKTNKIYIEGIDASFLITPEEVMKVIENPYSILPPKPELEQNSGTIIPDTPPTKDEGTGQEGAGNGTTEQVPIPEISTPSTSTSETSGPTSSEIVVPQN
ncbi:hypothetical protein [Niameybacter massiliensis]|uniref:hypothetical protein n=1 Tax=Niameybacter massiliensis TaxID=1658108 RepID=UPI0006B61849|nr:hypothetical protein [Niameybacter massiliensis]